MTATRPDPSIDLSELERDYIVKRELGSGGMGAVFLARHRTAGHDVAIKVISSKYIADADAMSRFEREARVLASLNHPHIGTIYGVDETDGVRALVLELVEGPTLAERLGGGPVPVREALSAARQIAEALTRRTRRASSTVT